MSNERLPVSEEDLLIRSLSSSFHMLSLENVSVRQMIEQKKRRKLEELRLERAVREQSAAVCRDCGQRGHASRRSRECPQRTQRTLSDNPAEAVAQRQQGRSERQQISSNPNFIAKPCPHCESLSHRSSRSAECPAHSRSSNELLRERLGTNREYFTRKLLFDTVVKHQYQGILREKVCLLSDFLRSVIVRTEILANSYFIAIEEPIPPVCFGQNFFYALTQLIRGQRMTTTNSRMPLQEIQRIWEHLKLSHPSLAQYPRCTVSRTVDTITEACVVLATSYVNNITLKFEGRVKYFLKYKISQKFPELSKGDISAIINEYAFPSLVMMEHRWPERIPRDIVLATTVDVICLQIRPHLPASVSMKSLSSSPGAFIPCMKFLLKELEQCQVQASSEVKDSESHTLPRLFSIVPNPSMQWRFVSLNAEILASFFTAVDRPRRPEDYASVFFEIFDFTHLRIRNLQELKFKNNKTAFANRVLTDGYAVNFAFGRKAAAEDSLSSVELSFEDFTDREVNAHFQLVVGDPGRTQVLTAAYGSGSASHEVRRVSAKEYYSMTGSAKRNSQEQRQKHQIGIDAIESQFPTPKTSHMEQYHRYISYILRYYEELTGFYNMRTAERRFQNYQGVQRARDEMANVFVSGGKKYNPSKRKNRSKNRKRRKKNARLRRRQGEVLERLSATRSTTNMQGPGRRQWVRAAYTPTEKLPLVVFGDAMFGKKNSVHFSGYRHGLVDVLWRSLKRRERQGELVAITLDEYLTSQVCNNCHTQELEKITTANHISHHGIASCKNCLILWQRDVNASKNMYDISMSLWRDGHRPPQFQRPPSIRPQPQIAAENAVSL